MSDLTSALVAMEEAVPNKSLGLDGLSYEFYHAMHSPFGRPPLLTALNAMLFSDILSHSLSCGIVRLLPTVSLASWLHLITLLSVDYNC